MTIPANIRNELLGVFERNCRDTREVYTVLHNRQQGNRLGEVAETYSRDMVAEMSRVADEHGLDAIRRDIAAETKLPPDKVWWLAWRSMCEGLRWAGPVSGAVWLPTVPVKFPPAPIARTEPIKDPIGFKPPLPAPGLTVAEVEALIRAAVEVAVREAIAKPEETTTDIEQVDDKGTVKKQTVRTKRRPL